MHILVHATLPQVHVAWLLWKNPQEARKVYWAFWRRNYYKVGEKNLSGAQFCPFFFWGGGNIFNEGQRFTSKFDMFFELDEAFLFGTWPFPLGLFGVCEGCRGTVLLVDTLSGADLGPILESEGVVGDFHRKDLRDFQC